LWTTRSETLLQRGNNQTEEDLDNAEWIIRFAQSISITSGKLCSKNIFCISEIEFADSMQVKQDGKNQKLSEKEQRLEEIQQKQNGKFEAAAQKYFEGKTYWWMI
jgi:hypothetical protein